MKKGVRLWLLMLLVPLQAGGSAEVKDPRGQGLNPQKASQAVRFATFNVYLNRPRQGQLLEELADANSLSVQAQAVAAIIQKVRPDVLLLNEFDFDRQGRGIDAFRDNYLGVAQAGGRPIHYEHVFLAPVNTGMDSGFDLDRDTKLSGPGDALGYGEFPGQYGMVLLSRFPIAKQRVRTFQNFLWRDMPGAHLPDDLTTTTPNDFYSSAMLDVLPLSSKSHWDIPIRIGATQVHILAAHPTPPVFDGEEDRNGKRNFDEIRLWADYVSAQGNEYIVDDLGIAGGLGEAPFVILGDYNSDPVDGDSTDNAIAQLLEHPLVNTAITPKSRGAREDALLEGQANTSQQGDPAADTGDFHPAHLGNLRLDYVLPSRLGLEALCAGVFWPPAEHADAELVGSGYPVVSSDHRLVWVDLRLK